MKKVYFNYLNNVLAIVKKYYALKEHLASLPEGHLYEVNTPGKGVLYYKYHKGKQIYVSKKNTALLKKFRMKADEEAKLSELKRIADLISNKAIRIMLEYLSSSENPSFKPSVSEENYMREELKHKTIHGELVRTKSEVIIADILCELGIVYLYEKELNTKYGRIYPDFTVIHPFTGEIYYIEHLGMMDNDKYADNWSFKLRKYDSIGISESNYLITTTEEFGVIDADVIKEKFEEIFTVKRFNLLLKYAEKEFPRKRI